MHYLGKFGIVNGLLEYTSGMMIRFYVDRSKLGYEELYLYSKDMYHIERGNCKGNFSYKLHWLAPGKTLTDWLLFLHDDATVRNMDNATPLGEHA